MTSLPGRSGVVVVGGCGHVGLPLAISLADAGVPSVALDIDAAVVASVNAGVMPFREDGADEVLRRVLDDGSFRATTEAAAIADADAVIVVIGTPVDERMTPDPTEVVRVLAECAPHLQDDQLVVLRSTVYPGVTRRVEEVLAERGLRPDVVFCPERIAEGHAMRELGELPQIVGARTERAAERAAALFGALGAEAVHLAPEEAELAKLFTNAWRYLKFAAANQFWLMSNEAGLDYSRIRRAIAHDYPRAADLPGAGFAAGPCLLKDTMQLAAFTNNNFVLGHAAMLVNEGQPNYLVDRIAERIDLGSSTVGVLGMAFKGESDDVRSSLSYPLKRALTFRAREVLTTDPYVTSDPDLLPLAEVLERSDALVIGAPHHAYRDLRTDVPVFDIWDLLGAGSFV
jgi:UDP-N-acetyl-D-mannosaminuronic acid dehydrogenase